MIKQFLPNFIAVAAAIAAVFGVVIPADVQAELVGKSVQGYEAVLILVAVADSLWAIAKGVWAKVKA